MSTIINSYRGPGPVPEHPVTIAQLQEVPIPPLNWICESPPSYEATMSTPVRMSATSRTVVPLVHGSFRGRPPIPNILTPNTFNRNGTACPQYNHPQPPPSYAESEFGMAGRWNRTPGQLSFQYAPSLQSVPFTRRPRLTACPNCGYISWTNTINHFTRQAHATCITLCVCGCFPCCWFPYAIPCCKETRHYCAVCRRLVGIYNPWELRDGENNRRMVRWQPGGFL